MNTDANALEARNTGYHQMADHDQHTLIERLEFAVDSDRQLAAALRGAAAALEDAASRYEALADVTDPDAAVGYLVRTGTPEPRPCGASTASPGSRSRITRRSGRRAPRRRSLALRAGKC